MAEEQGVFDFDAVADAMVDKMVRRHPHVFAGHTYADLTEQVAAWDAIKAAERAGKARHSILDDVPPGLPAMTRAVKLTRRAARVGFDWPSTDEVMAKLREEIEELQHEIDAGDLPKARAELGDLLFVVAQPGPQARRGPRGRASGLQRQVRAPLPPHREGPGRARQDPRPVDAWRRWTPSGTTPRRWSGKAL